MGAIAEALDIPTYARPRYSISSGTLGILAGLVPSAFSLYALRVVTGQHFSREENPNILSKLFDYPVTPDIDYPGSVWTYLNAVPASGKFKEDTCRKWLMDLWLKDKELRSLKHADSKQIHRVTGTMPGRHSVTIELLSTRLAMLEQLSAMIFRMKGILLELVRAARDV